MGHLVTTENLSLPPGLHQIDGPIMRYPWGDCEFLPAFLHRPADGQPWAEWWLGTHPNGPAHLSNGQPLKEVAGPLPFLVKVLAAAEPLSLQLHPTASQAAAGHATGQYRDPHPKPELIHALTEFEAFCGIRPEAATLRLLNDHDLGDLADLVRSSGVANAIRAILTKEFDPSTTLRTCAQLTAVSGDSPLHRSISWIGYLTDLYPNDPAVVATLLLHHVRLRPGQALRLTAGTLHAYLRGAGIEVMGPSDNVVRCGLTTKHVDIDQVLTLLDPTEIADPIIPEGAPQDLPEIGIGLWQLPAGQIHQAATALIAVTAEGKGYFVEAGTQIQMASHCYLIGDNLY
jgi:mannose-6-phosphate isomerase